MPYLHLPSLIRSTLRRLCGGGQCPQAGRSKRRGLVHWPLHPRAPPLSHVQDLHEGAPRIEESEALRRRQRVPGAHRRATRPLDAAVTVAAAAVIGVEKGQADNNAALRGSGG